MRWIFLGAGFLLAATYQCGGDGYLAHGDLSAAFVACDANTVWYVDRESTGERLYRLVQMSRADDSVQSVRSLASSASAQLGPAFAADGNQFFWVVDNKLMSMALDAGSVATVLDGSVAGVLIGLGPMAVDAKNIYAFASSSTSGALELLAIPRFGGPPLVVVTNGSLVLPTALATDGAAIFWTDWGSIPPNLSTVSPSGAVMKAPIDGSSAPVILAGAEWYPTSLTVDPTGVYWIDAGCDRAGVPSETRTVGISGGPVTTIATDSPQDICVSGSRSFGRIIQVGSGSIYWLSAFQYVKRSTLGGPFSIQTVADAGDGHTVLTLSVCDQAIYAVDVSGNGTYGLRKYRAAP